ncbi:glutathione S-transferase family protein [Leisingera sp. ANG-Vp]|uniref:glutathione S-transferase family protein n=1 Tax=Leisingera sp. ANG-Vp TaxID=1577896 RepID=UPI00057D2B98|nr:glutathione S-transferase family protein [Leisingera sp. ANG-Vp]KIC20938.1 hypothetical protein RA20_06695 [Leisingera sp. ANG-Vp]
MKLYLINGSPNGRKVLSVVNHLGISPEIEWLDIFGGQNRTEEYLALNPNGLAPTLVDGDLVLWESNAINVYLCETTPGQTLLPTDPAGRATVMKWLCWDLAHYNKALGAVAFEAVAKPKFLGSSDINQPVIDYFTERFDRYGPILDQHLADRDFVAGDSWTIADYALGHVEMFQQLVPIDWNRFPNLVRFYDRLRDNPNWASTMPKPGEVGKIPS